MTEKFSNAVEARKYLDSLLKQIKNVSFNADIRQIWTNVNAMVDELSTIEVRCRQRNNWNADVHLIANYGFLSDDEARLFAAQEQKYLFKENIFFLI